MNLQDLVHHVPYGATRRFQCPACSPERRKSQMKDLSVTRTDDALLYNCHHCGEQGAHKVTERTLSAVPKITTTPLSEIHLNFLKTRGISPETAATAKLLGGMMYFRRLNKEAPCIAFPYYKDGKLVANKYRAIETKDFTQSAGGAHDLFLIDNVVPGKPIIIVEGEIDALTLMECGIENGVSVPGGAPMKVADGTLSASEDKRLSFIWNANEIIKRAPWVIIATDNDAPGHALAEEIARRVGKEKCKLAKLTHKDINEVFLAEGKDAVISIIEKAEPYPVAGLSSAADFADKINDLWSKGTGKGMSTGYQNVDQIYTVAPGQLTVVTGYPSSGKSNFVDQLMCNLAAQYDWKFALCSFENAPEIHITRLIEIHTKRRFFDGTNRMTEEEFKQGYDWVSEHFVFLTSESSEPATVDSILERARSAVARLGVRGMVIDPYNYIELDRGHSETEAISNMLTRVQQFAKASGVHVWFVAHPSKINRQGVDLPRPDGMSISGSMAWWAKADCGVTIHRRKGGQTEVAVWKCRYRWVGGQGETALDYDKPTGTYKEITDFF
ncbi:toprim domain-containing protein [bacterium]|nr:toprim domain-containing protein [bacterium]